MLTIFITLADKKILRGLGIAAALVTAAGILAVLVEIFVDLYALGIVAPVWSWFVVAPCLSIAALLVMLDKSEKFRQELAKRLHV